MSAQYVPITIYLFTSHFANACGAQVLLNITSSIYLAVSAGSISRTATLGITAVNVAVLVAARQYVGGFWKGAAKIPLPGAGKYNHAVGDTQEIRLNMAYLMAAWIGSGVLSLLS